MTVNEPGIMVYEILVIKQVVNAPTFMTFIVAIVKQPPSPSSH